MPIFGNNTILGSTANLEHWILGAQYTTPAGGPYNLTKITAYLLEADATRLIKFAVYDSSNNLIAQTEERSIPASSAAWYDFDFTEPFPVLNGATDYILVGWAGAGLGALNAYYGAGTTNQGHYRNLDYAANFPDPGGFLEYNYQYSYYGTLVIDPAVSDDLNLWLEAADIIGPIYPNIEAADDLNSWNDNLIVVYGIHTEALSISATDNFIVNTGKPPRYDWKDGVQYYAGIESGLFISLDDLAGYLSDEIETSFIVWFNSVIGQAYDSMMYNWNDSVSVISIVAKVLADKLNLTDEVALRYAVFLSTSDQITLTDLLQTFIRETNAFSDQLDLSDGVSTALSVLAEASASDTLEMSDLAAVLTGYIPVTAADTLEMSDAISNLVASSFNSYIRRYLNDIVD
jgi:hypothetical protein